MMVGGKRSFNNLFEQFGFGYGFFKRIMLPNAFNGGAVVGIKRDGLGGFYIATAVAVK